MSERKYRFAVRLENREVTVTAADRYWATREAARALGVIWRETARDMTVAQIGRTPVKEGQA